MEEVQPLKDKFLASEYPNEKLFLTKACLTFHKNVSWLWTAFM